MTTGGTPRILVCAGLAAELAEWRRLLGAGHDSVGVLFGQPEPPEAAADGLGGYRLLLVDGSRQAAPAVDCCRRLRLLLAGRFVPILFVTAQPRAEGDSSVRLAALEAGADACLERPVAAGELSAQVGALLRLKETHDRLADRASEAQRINQRLHQAYQQINQELELAQRIQNSFLPQTLPQVTGLRFAVHYLLCGKVGGDFYDAFRLDENHVGFYVADAMGHGVPASLLTIFVKKGVRGKEVFGRDYRLVPPAEVLQRLNKDLIEQHLAENPFITMAYGLLNHRDGTVRLARAGHPYPLHVPREGELQLWRQHGVLLGVLDATFPELSYRLAPADKLLLYSDGVDTAVFEDHPPGTDSLLACAARHRSLPVAEFVARLARDLFGGAAQPDDLTLLGLELAE
jgi:sigma-B regulation protein RsbU (phosphoserine phosphatase)